MTTPTIPGTFSIDQAIVDTRTWVDRAVIGLNLCPFAKAAQVKGQVHYAVSTATDPAGLLEDLLRELRDLAEADEELRDNTLLVHPHVLQSFDDFLAFLEITDDLLADEGLEGVIQIASFHPEYQFEGTRPDDISNYTNRSPYPTLHLLRESSVDRAVEAYPEAEAIFEKNIETLERLGKAGWEALGVRKRDDPPTARSSPTPAPSTDPAPDPAVRSRSGPDRG